MERVAADGAGIARAVSLVRAGHLVVYPTETMYGLGADASSSEAVARVAAAKGRPEDQPLPILVVDRDMLARVVSVIPPAAEPLMEEHWPGPLTLVLPAATGLSRLLTNHRGGVGVRISSDPVATALVRGLGQPLTATSANRSGDPPAMQADRVVLGRDVALILDGGARGERPSTVVEVMPGCAPRLLRRGALKLHLPKVRQ